MALWHLLRRSPQLWPFWVRSRRARLPARRLLLVAACLWARGLGDERLRLPPPRQRAGAQELRPPRLGLYGGAMKRICSIKTIVPRTLPIVLFGLTKVGSETMVHFWPTFGTNYITFGYFRTSSQRHSRGAFHWTVFGPRSLVFRSFWTLSHLRTEAQPRF